jgi:hypothetical protein
MLDEEIRRSCNSDRCQPKAWSEEPDRGIFRWRRERKGPDLFHDQSSPSGSWRQRFESFCYVTAHLALDLVDEREAEEILNYWEEHLEEGS